jgi:hypothetical protein
MALEVLHVTAYFEFVSKYYSTVFGNVKTVIPTEILAPVYVVHPRCLYAIYGGVGPSDTTELCSVLYWFCDDMFRPRKPSFTGLLCLTRVSLRNNDVPLIVTIFLHA